MFDRGILWQTEIFMEFQKIWEQFNASIDGLIR